MKFNQRIAARFLLKLSIVLVIIWTFGCDAGVGYYPKDWMKIDEHNYSKTFGLIDFEINPLSGLTGNGFLLPQITIHNHTETPVVIVKAILKANGSEYTAKPFSKDGWETVPSSETRKVTMAFELNKPLVDVLKDPVELNITMKFGDEFSEINIPMVKKY